MKFDLSTANEFAQRGEIENWVDNYLRTGDWINLGLANGLKHQQRWWAGPLLVPLENMVRVCGPEKGMEYPQEAKGWEKAINKLEKSLRDLKDVPPFITQYRGGELSLRDGSHRHEAFKRLGWQKAWILIWYDSKAEFDADNQRRLMWLSS